MREVPTVVVVVVLVHTPIMVVSQVGCTPACCRGTLPGFRPFVRTLAGRMVTMEGIDMASVNPCSL